METMLVPAAPKRTCDCPENHLGCLTPKEWSKAQVSVWKFNYTGRDIRDKNKHPATFPVQLAAKAISIFTHEGELVLDPFMGSGTTMVAAQEWNRNVVGFELSKDYVDLALSRKTGAIFSQVAEIVHDDCLNAPKYLAAESVKLIVTSPPYANMLNVKRKNKSRFNPKNNQYKKIEQYSQDPRDLGTMASDEYEAAMEKIFKGLYPLVVPGGNCIINISDLFIDGQRELLHVNIINALEAAGFQFRNTIIWDKTNLLNGIGIFGYPSNFLIMGAFEYILHFRKPPIDESEPRESGSAYPEIEG